jgi:hypothetical protein
MTERQENGRGSSSDPTGPKHTRKKESINVFEDGKRQTISPLSVYVLTQSMYLGGGAARKILKITDTVGRLDLVTQIR